MKRILIIALCWMIFSGCAKNVSTPATTSTTNLIIPVDDSTVASDAFATREIAVVDYVSDLGWVLIHDNKTQVADNFPKEYEKQGLQVMVVYTLLAKHGQTNIVGSGISYIHIVHIGLLSPTDK